MNASEGRLFKSPFDNEVVFVAITEDQSEPESLHPAEVNILSPTASQKTRRRFITGRTAARQVLDQISVGREVPLLRGDGGEPIWPQGIVGSISHCENWAIAAGTRDPDIRSLGIDLENWAKFEPPDSSLIIFSTSELRWAQQDRSCELQRLAILFSGKEAVFKALYPAYGRSLEIGDIRLQWQATEQRFHIGLPSTISINSNLSFTALPSIFGNYVLSSTILRRGL